MDEQANRGMTVEVRWKGDEQTEAALLRSLGIKDQSPAHGLRVLEACALRLNQVDIESRVLHVSRLRRNVGYLRYSKGGRLNH